MFSDNSSEASEGSLTGLAWFLFIILLLVGTGAVTLLVLLLRLVEV